MGSHRGLKEFEHWEWRLGWVKRAVGGGWKDVQPGRVRRAVRRAVPAGRASCRGRAGLLRARVAAVGRPGWETCGKFRNAALLCRGPIQIPSKRARAVR